MNRRLLPVCLGALAGALLLPEPAVAQTKIEPRYNLYSEQQDIELGQQAAKEAEKQLPLLSDPTVTAYVQELGNRLVAKARGPKYPYSFRVVNSSELNAFALPGGPLFLNRGVIESARNDGEIAGVLAHEIAHVVLRHGTANMTKSTITQQGFGILGGLIGSRVGHGTADLVNMAGGFGAQMLILKNSRDAETEADLYGAQILARSGFNPDDMVGFFETMDRMTKADHSATANWFSDHPTPDRRIERITEEARLLQIKPAKTTSTTALAPVQAKLKQIPAAQKTQTASSGKDKSQPQGTPGGSGSRPAASGPFDPPSGRATTFSSKAGGYRVDYPSNWTAREGAKGSVLLAPPGGVQEQGEKSSVLCGAIVDRYARFGNDARSEDDGVQASAAVEKAFDDLRDQVLQGHPELVKVPQSGRAFKKSDGSAKGLRYEALRQDGGGETVTIYARQLADRGIVYLLFVSPKADAARQEPALKTIIDSLGTANR